MFNLEVSLLYIICLFSVKADTVTIPFREGENMFLNNDTYFRYGNMGNNLEDELDGTGPSLEYENATSAYQEEDNDLSPVYTYYYEDFVLDNGNIIYKPPPSHEYPYSPYYLCVQQVDHITPYIQLDIVCGCTKNPPEDNCCPLGHVIFLVQTPESTLYNCYMMEENLHNYNYWSMILYQLQPSFLLHNNFHCEGDGVEICNWNKKRDFIIISGNQPFAHGNGSLHTGHVHFEKDYICQDKGKYEKDNTTSQSISCAREYERTVDYYTYIPGLVFYPLILLTFLILPEIRNMRINIIMCQTLCYLVMELQAAVYFLSDQELPKNHCYFHAFLRLYAGLAATFWINVLNIDMGWTFSGRRTHHSDQWKFTMYSIYGWGGPSFITIVAIIFWLCPVPDIISPEMNLYTCWFLRYEAMFAYDVGTEVILTIFSGVLMIYTLYKIVQGVCKSEMLENKESGRHVGNKKNTGKDRWIVFINLGLLIGTPRIINFLPALYDNGVVFHVLNFISMFRSSLIFAFLCLKPKVFKLLKQRAHEWRGRLCKLRERVTCFKKLAAAQEGSGGTTCSNNSKAKTLSTYL